MALWLEDGNEVEVMQADVIAVDTLRGERRSYHLWVEGKRSDFACDGHSGGLEGCRRLHDWELARAMGIREYVGTVYSTRKVFRRPSLDLKSI